jgi:hypothetical protein
VGKPGSYLSGYASTTKIWPGFYDQALTVTQDLLLRRGFKCRMAVLLKMAHFA